MHPSRRVPKYALYRAKLPLPTTYPQTELRREHTESKLRPYLLAFQQPAKGASDFQRLTASLKRCPDTKPEFLMRNPSFSASCEAVPYPKPIYETSSGQPAKDSIACIASGGSVRSRLARSCFMCSGSEVPVRGRIPTVRAKLNTIWAGVALAFAARLALVSLALVSLALVSLALVSLAIRGWRSTS